MILRVFSFFVFLVYLPSSIPQSTIGQLRRRFEYKHSFRAPNLAQRDGTIPFWMITGDAIASSEQIRLAPSMRSRKGIAWNKRPLTESEDFEINVGFKITGQGRIGADGLAVWYTAQQGTLGPVFGASDYWTGMGLFFDSFDNDGQRNNPYVALLVNDGTRSYDHQTDGSQQMIAGCQRDFRNKPYPVRVKIEYIKHVLTVSMSDGLQPTPRYELCLRSENIVLPKNGYFGLSAATGGLADDHDVVDFSVFSMPTTVARPSSDKLQSAEKQKYEAEFEEQMKEYEKEKQKFKEQHPDKAQPGDEDWAKVHEDASQRELRLIYESQSAIYSVMQQMERKLDEIKQLQNAHTSMLQQGGAVLPQGGKPPVSSGDGFLQGEKAEVIQSLRDLTSGIREMKNYVNEIFTRTYNMEKKFSGGAVSTADSGLSTYLENIQNDIRSIKTSQFHQGGSGGTLPPVSGCPDPNCLSSSFFISVLALQSIVICILIVYKGKQEKAKFY